LAKRLGSGSSVLGAPSKQLVTRRHKVNGTGFMASTNIASLLSFQ